MSVERARVAFGPEALSRFSQIIEEVSLNLIDDGLTAELVRSDEMRRKLARKLMGFASHWWTDSQIKQLLLRSCATRSRLPAGTRPRRGMGWGQELTAYETVRLMTGSDDTVLDDVSIERHAP